MILPLYVPIFLRPLSTAMRCLTISVTHRALLAALSRRICARQTKLQRHPRPSTSLNHTLVASIKLHHAACSTIKHESLQAAGAPLGQPDCAKT